MASVKLKFRPSSASSQEGSIFYQIIHNRKPRQLLSGYHIFPCEWDEKQSRIRPALSVERDLSISIIRENIRWDMERLTRIIRKFDNNIVEYTSDDVIEEFRKQQRENTLFNYMVKLIGKLKLQGQIRTSETYSATLNSFRKFRKGEDIMLDSMTSAVMEEYENWLQQRRIVPNTISFYTRILRAVYNRAIEEEITIDRKPFRRVYTGIDKTIKRALTLSMIKKIKTFDLSLHPRVEHARDIFILSFMLRGMSLIDMAYLKKVDRRNGYIQYRRRKTGQVLIIQWTKEMQSILDKYPENKTEYLLPIIMNSETNQRYEYHNAASRINYHLNQLGGMLGISIPLTLYVARHSWASAAKTKGIPLSVISEGMGHENEATTRIYLSTLDTSAVDNANSLIIKSI